MIIVKQEIIGDLASINSYSLCMGGEFEVNAKNKRKKNEKLSAKQKILTAVLVVIILLMGLVIYLILNKKEGGLVIDDSNLEEVETQLTDSVADGMFEINMNTVWHFPNGKAASTDAYVANGSANKHPISFEVLLDGTEEIYTSTIIPLGKQIKEIVLDKKLEAGDYKAVCFYHLWNEDGTESSSCGVDIVLSIVE